MSVFVTSMSCPPWSRIRACTPTSAAFAFAVSRASASALLLLSATTYLSTTSCAEPAPRSFDRHPDNTPRTRQTTRARRRNGVIGDTLLRSLGEPCGDGRVRGKDTAERLVVIVGHVLCHVQLVGVDPGAGPRIDEYG